VHLSGPLPSPRNLLHRYVKSGSGSAEPAVHRVLLAASKHKRSSGSDETKRKNYEEKFLERRSVEECENLNKRQDAQIAQSVFKSEQF